jgi:hypothetical protein
MPAELARHLGANAAGKPSWSFASPILDDMMIKQESALNIAGELDLLPKRASSEIWSEKRIARVTE